MVEVGKFFKKKEEFGSLLHTQWQALLRRSRIDSGSNRRLMRPCPS
jgi:hypothetical protein